MGTSTAGMLQVERLREGCYQLFGFRLEMASTASKGAPDTTIVLRPRYEAAGAELIFHTAKSGELSLLPNDYTTRAEVAQQVSVYIDR